jgi:hypothetical protein
LLLCVVLVAACGDNKKSSTSIDAPPMQIDAGPDAFVKPTSEQIADARAAADGDVDLPINGATVTYLKPAVGGDPAGFTIQADQMGPALFIAVNPTTTTPVLVKGDVVSFRIKMLGTTGGQKRALAIDGLMRTSQGANVGALAQNVSAATDLVTALDSYDSEIVDVTGALSGNFAFAGAGFEKIQITTAGIGTASSSFQVRVPSTLRDAVDFVNTCTMFTLNDAPVHRNNAEVQLSAFVPGDITLSGCPAPTLVKAVAATSTTVKLTFSRNILASSVVADGSQFTFDNGLTASSAAVNGRTVTVTTGAQTAVTNYTVTVANTVTDLQGTAVTTNTDAFEGFVAPAVVRINEVNANITNPTGCDLIELRVITGGSMTGARLQERNGGSGEMSLEFGSLQVATNDIIVVHLNATPGTAGNCNTGGSQNETAIDGQLAATFTRNYDTAFDWFSPDTGLTSTDNVFTLFNRLDEMIDVVLVDDGMAGSNVAAASETAAAAAAAAQQWEMVGGGIPAGGFVDDDFRLHAVLDSDATGTTNTGDTLHRVDNTDDDNKDDWAQGPHSWGVANPGQ